MGTGAGARRYWLLKSEPAVFGFEDLLKSPRRKCAWDGVRNYQARNLLRDEMQKGDLALFYHSGARPPGVAGIARIVGPASPDPTQFDPHSEAFDPKARHAAPPWVQVQVEAVRPLTAFVPIDRLRAEKRLSGMWLLRRGQRLSVQPVTEKEWRCILDLGGLDPDQLC